MKVHDGVNGLRNGPVTIVYRSETARNKIPSLSGGDWYEDVFNVSGVEDGLLYASRLSDKKLFWIPVCNIVHIYREINEEDGEQ